MAPWDVAEDWQVGQQLGLVIIGRAVLAGRLGRGWTQRQLAWRVGLSQSTISRLETGRLRAMRMATLARIVGALNMDPVLLADGGPPSSNRRLPGSRAA
jgi:transcriptional regulator with XRE-family HTH domain